MHDDPPELLAQWCVVPITTAIAWKEGKKQPSPAALKLFRLHADGRVMPDEFEGFRFVKGTLVPNGRLGFTPAQVHAYEQVYMIAMTHARSDVEAHLERMKLLQREQPPEAAEPRQPAPRWIWDAFFNPLEGTRAVQAGTDGDRKD